MENEEKHKRIIKYIFWGTLVIHLALLLITICHNHYYEWRFHLGSIFFYGAFFTGWVWFVLPYKICNFILEDHEILRRVILIPLAILDIFLFVFAVEIFFMGASGMGYSVVYEDDDYAILSRFRCNGGPNGTLYRKSGLLYREIGERSVYAYSNVKYERRPELNAIISRYYTYSGKKQALKAPFDSVPCCQIYFLDANDYRNNPQALIDRENKIRYEVFLKPNLFLIDGEVNDSISFKYNTARRRLDILTDNHCIFRSIPVHLFRRYPFTRLLLILTGCKFNN